MAQFMPKRGFFMGKLTTKEAAALAGMTARSFEMLRFRHAGPVYYKVGRRVLYDADDVRAWLEKFKVDPERREDGKDDAA